MSDRKDSSSEIHKQNNDSREKRGYSLPPTTSKPPMPPVKPPKKK